jgi:hypothetical protein
MRGSEALRGVTLSLPCAVVARRGRVGRCLLCMVITDMDETDLVPLGMHRLPCGPCLAAATRKLLDRRGTRKGFLLN